MEEAIAAIDHKRLEAMYNKLTTLSIKRKLTCDAYYRTNQTIFEDQTKS
jgi:hypothetical protein